MVERNLDTAGWDSSPKNQCRGSYSVDPANSVDHIRHFRNRKKERGDSVAYRLRAKPRPPLYFRALPRNNDVFELPPISQGSFPLNSYNDLFSSTP